MAHWLDTAIVGTALLASGLFLVRLYRKKPTAACGNGCGGACAPMKTPELVQIGRREAAKPRTSIASVEPGLRASTTISG
jgi:hypothetical protein